MMMNKSYHDPPLRPDKLPCAPWRARITWWWYTRVVTKWKWLKGEWWCSRRHKPLIRDCGGWGGRDVWGRPRKAYAGLRCLKCGNHWDTTRQAKPLTRQQKQACAEMFGSMWVGDKGTAEEIGEKVINLIVSSGLISVDGDYPVVFVWSANAASQIGEMVCRELEGAAI